jgi:hypothetical protein
LLKLAYGAKRRRAEEHISISDRDKSTRISGGGFCSDLEDGVTGEELITGVLLVVLLDEADELSAVLLLGDDGELQGSGTAGRQRLSGSSLDGDRVGVAVDHALLLLTQQSHSEARCSATAKQFRHNNAARMCR